ncbi:MAG: hypothetical protein JWM11_6134, partial [Planctomycetaceae bacterium]|nr:hypothetical protein [Planctomycetaceae bacterium]
LAAVLNQLQFADKHGSNFKLTISTCRELGLV